jgi:hypothetical protein
MEDIGYYQYQIAILSIGLTVGFIVSFFYKKPHYPRMTYSWWGFAGALISWHILSSLQLDSIPINVGGAIFLSLITTYFFSKYNRAK